MDNKSKRRIIIYILWGAILFSNFVFLFVFKVGSITPATNATINNVLIYGTIGYSVVAAIVSLVLFLRASSPVKIREIEKSLDLSTAPGKTELQREQFHKLPELVKKKILIEQKALALFILSWIIGETINIAGLNLILMGGPKGYYIYFFVVAVIIHLRNFPKTFFKSLDENIK